MPFSWFLTMFVRLGLVKMPKRRGAFTPPDGHREIRRLRNKRQRKARAMHYRRLRFA